ncbi:hypothetical protein AXJ14_gp129 [Geobacillus virus E3]|jgi:hypothetical protein|uniref:hypothetical protein n=1 Tax=Geobacillus virus E3 TaxID=1572712 RepID=UPI0006719976|nr:hypothetical protein AXJ14_gp129 [Geobacillus virus E3]AJA41448.1 hypothetical protein E3_0129 [Geobacillus virus E3]
MSLLRNFADSNQRLGYKLLSEDDKSVTLYKVYGEEIIILQNMQGEVSVVSLWKSELKDLLNNID